MIDTATCNLNRLACGQRASIQGMDVGADLHARLVAMGVQPGKAIQVIRRAALGGPLHVRVGTTEIILRRQEAALIDVDPRFELAA